MTRRLSLALSAALVTCAWCAAAGAQSLTPTTPPTVRAERTGGASPTLDLALDERLATSWRQIRVERLAVRTAGRQVRITRRPESRTLTLTTPAGRCALVLADVSTATDDGRGGLRATKIVTCPDAGDPGARTARIRAGGVLSAKTGARIELQPLLNPATVRPGKDLAVRAYLDGAVGAGRRITATRTGVDGPERTLDAWTDAHGITSFTLPRSGRWTIRFRPHDGRDAPEAALVFDVEPAAFWSRPARLSDEPPLARREGETDARPEDPAWRPLGPAPIDEVEWSGRIADLAVSPTHPDRYVAAAASGGVWTTESGGTSWQARSDSLPTLALGSIAVDPHDESVLYAGSGEGHGAYHSLYGLGVYKSTDGGHSWRVLGRQTFEGRAVSRLAVSPTDPRTVWAAVSRAGGSFGDYEGAKLHPRRLGPVGLYRSNDAGATWNPASSTLPATPANDIDFDPLDPNRLWVTFSDPYQSSGNGIYRSTDGGATFQRIFFTQTFGRTELAVSPSDPNRLYALLSASLFRLFEWGGYHPFGGYTVGVWSSDDGGANWTYHFPGNIQRFQGDYNAAVAVHPDDPDTVFAAGVSMVRSTDGGATWVDVTPPHQDVHRIAFDAAGRLLVATDGGVYRSDDLGDTWEARNRHLGSIQLYPGVSVDPRHRGRLLGGTQDNGTLLSAHSSEDWVWIHGGDGGYTAFHPDDLDVVFAELQGEGNLFRSDDGGLSFERLEIPTDFDLDVTAFQAPFQLDPSEPDRMLYATRRIFESTDRGETWTPISGDLTDTDITVDLSAIRSLAIAPSNGRTVYATTNNQHLLVSEDGGATWNLRREDVYGWPRILRQIAVDPLDDATAYVAVARFGGAKVLATHDRGATWQPIGADLPDLPVNCVAVHREAGVRTVFAGTDRGVWSSDDEGATWRLVGQDLPAAPVMDLVVDTDHRRLVAATLGRGLWEIPMAL